MSASSFVEYASSERLNADEIYTIELLIERVRSKFDPEYWHTWGDQNDARAASDYKPSFLKDHLQPASAELQKLSWISFQRIGDAERPVRDLNALRYLPELTALVLINNQVSDLTPLQDCRKLRKLYLNRNPVRDISSLAACVDLEELELDDAPIEDASPLKALPALRILSLSAEQLPAFERIECLPALTKLELGSGDFDSFDGLPLMPELRVIRGAHVGSLSGLQRFPKLENLVNLSGSFDSLAPLAEAKHLTHVNVSNSRIRCLEPLSRLFALRALWLNTEASELDLSPLERLPSLHQVTIKCAGKELESLAKLRSELVSWDVEFRSVQPRHTPSLELQVVDQKTFDLYDTARPFGMSDSDTNASLLSSELEWLDRQLEEVFAVDFKEDADYVIPFRWSGARSRTVVLLSEPAVSAFARLVLGMQAVLCHANNDWIIYLQSEDLEIEFIVWVYPQKIMVTEEYADAVRDLIIPK